MRTKEAQSYQGEQTTSAQTVMNIAWYEAERRLASTAVLIGGFTIIGVLFVALMSHLATEVPLEEVISSLPEMVVELLGFRPLVTFEGLIAAEFHGLGWVIGLGAYFAYTAAGSIAGDIESDRIELLLAAPISRTDIILGKYLALLVPIIGINVIVPLPLYVGALLVGESFNVVNLLAVHALSIPYLLCCGAIGVSIAVIIRWGQTSKRTSAGLIIAMWLIGGAASTSGFDWLSTLTPMHHFHPPNILIDGVYDVTGAVILLFATIILLAVSRVVFSRINL